MIIIIIIVIIIIIIIIIINGKNDQGPRSYPGLSGRADKWTQCGGAKNTFFLVTLYNFQKKCWGYNLPTPPSPRFLMMEKFCTSMYHVN